MKKLALLICLLVSSGFVMPSFAQHHDPAPPATLGNRIAVMDFVFPEKVAANQDFTLTMTLYDKTNNKKFEHLSTQLAIYKERIKNPLMNALFYDKNGEIVIDFKAKSFEKKNMWIVQAAQETYLGGYMGEYGSHIKVLQNIFSENALYRLEATVVSIDNPRQFIEHQITFTKEIHIGKHQQTSNAGETEIKIPLWVKNTAKWWSEGSIGDKDFAAGIQFMVREKIIQIPIDKSSAGEAEIQIPLWVKNTAKWWSEGSIGDKDFAAGIQHLIKLGIIHG